MTDDRAAFAAALRAGQPAALDRLYREHARAVLGWCVRLGAPGADAEDAAHEVFMVALAQAGAWRGDAAPSTWLFQITRRVLANQRRRMALRRVFAWGAEPAEPALAEAALGREASRRLVQRALERLPTAQREALVLVDLDERPATEAAELLGVPVGTVYSRLHAARRAFAVAAAAEGLGHGDGAPVLVPGRSR